MRQRENRSLHISEPAARRGGRSNGRSAVDVGAGGVPSRRILSKAEVIEKMAACQQYALALMPYAFKAIADATHSEDPRLRFSAAIKLCEIAGVPQSSCIEQVLETREAADQREEERRLVFLGLAMDAMMQKSDLYKMPLSPEFVKDVQELNDRVQKLAKQPELEEKAAPIIRRRVTINE